MIQKILWFVCAASMACSSRPAQVNSGASAEAVAGAPLSEPPPFLAYFDNSYRSLLYVSDPMPHLNRALKSPITARLVAQLIANIEPGEDAPDLAQGRALLAKARGFVPVHTAVGFTDDSMVSLVQFVRALIAMSLCRAATQTGSESGRADLPKLQEALLAVVSKLRTPTIRVWVAFRDDEHAAQVLELFRGWLEELPASAVTLQRTEISLVASMSAAGAVPREVWPMLLTGFGVVTGPDDPMAPALMNAMRQLQLRAELIRDGASLRLTISDDPAPRPGTPTRLEYLSPLFTDAPSMAAWTRWDLTAMKPELDELSRFVERWRDTPAGRELLGGQAELLHKVDDLEEQLRESPARGQSRLDIGDDVRWTAHHYDPKPAPSLASTGMIAQIPAGLPLVYMDATMGLDELLDELLQTTREGILEDDEDDEDEDGDGDVGALGSGEDGAEALVQRMAQEALERELRVKQLRLLKPIERLIQGDARALFEPPVAILGSLEGTLDHFAVTVTEGGEVTEQIDVRGVPIPELAVIAKVSAQAAPSRGLPPGVALVDDMYREWIEYLFAIDDEPMPQGVPMMASVDLGLGVPTWELTADWARATPGESIELQVAGDLRVHCFMAGAFLVFSTSPALSRRILGQGPRQALPSDLALRLYGVVDMEHITRYMDSVMGWIDREFSLSAENKKGARLIMSMLEVIDRGVWRTWDADGVRVQSMVVTWASPEASSTSPASTGR